MYWTPAHQYFISAGKGTTHFSDNLSSSNQEIVSSQGFGLMHWQLLF